MMRPKVLIVDEDAKLCEVLAKRLGAMGLEVSIAKDASEAIQKGLAEKPALIIADAGIRSEDGLFVHKILNEFSGTLAPVIYLTGSGSDPDREHARNLGGAAYFEKPIDLDALLAAVRGCLNMNTEQIPSIEAAGKRRVLVIDDDRDIVRGMDIRLRAAGFDVTFAHDGACGVTMAVENHPDLVLLDVRMPGMDGPAVLTALRADPAARNIPVVVISANVVERTRALMLDLGACEFLEKPCDSRKLLNAIETALERTPRKPRVDRRQKAAVGSKGAAQ